MIADAGARRAARAIARRPLLFIAALAILLRASLALFLGDRADPVSGAADQYSYDALAQRVLAGHGFTFPSPWYPFTEPEQPTAHWSYLYTFYLAGVYAFVGHHPLVARLLQVLSAALHCWLIQRIGQRLFSPRVGLVAAAFTAGYAYFVFFSAALMTQAFYILAVLATMNLALELQRNPTRRRWLLLGIALGTGTLLRQNLLLFAPVLMTWIVSASHGRVRGRDLLVSLAALGAMILPWTAYNYLSFGDFLLLNSNGGFFLYSSNHPNQGTHFDPNYAAPLPEHLRGLSEPAVDRALYREAFGFIVADPLRFIRLTLSRVPHYFWLLPSAQSPALSNLARLASFALCLPLFLYGFFLSRTRWRACLPLYLYVAFDTVLHLMSWAAPRYRLPSDALMMVFAGLAVVNVWQHLAGVSMLADASVCPQSANPATAAKPGS